MAPKKHALAQIIDDSLAEAELLPDEEVLAGWALAGERLEQREPAEFRERYRFLLSAFADKPDLDATKENWIRLGARLLARKDARRAMLKISLATNLKYDMADSREKEN